MRTLRERIAELQAAHEAQVGSVLQQYQALRAQVTEYHADMEAAMHGALQPAAAGGGGAHAAASACSEVAVRASRLR